MKPFNVGRPIRYRFSPTGSWAPFHWMVGAGAAASGSRPVLESGGGVWGDGIMRLPPAPELDLEGERQPPHEQLGARPPAAEDLGLSRHFRLEEMGVIVDLRGD